MSDDNWRQLEVHVRKGTDDQIVRVGDLSDEDLMLVYTSYDDDWKTQSLLRREREFRAGFNSGDRDIVWRGGLVRFQDEEGHERQRALRDLSEIDLSLARGQWKNTWMTPFLNDEYDWRTRLYLRDRMWRERVIWADERTARVRQFSTAHLEHLVANPDEMGDPVISDLVLAARELGYRQGVMSWQVSRQNKGWDEANDRPAR